MARQAKGPRVRGPYQHRASGRWYIELVGGRDPDTGRVVREVVYSGSKAEAKRKAKIARRTGPGSRISIQDAIDAYETRLRVKGLRTRSVGSCCSSIKLFLGDTARDTDVVTIPFLQKQVQARLDEGKRVDTVATELRNVKTFIRRSVAQGLFENVVKRLDEVVVEGPRSRGKPQLTVDEARKYLKAALEKEGDAPAAAMMPLLMNLRAREILDRQVRDLDDDGRLFWVHRGKTRRSNRRVEVPEVLRGRLLKLAEGKKPEDWLFLSPTTGRPRSTTWLQQHVRKICDRAKVPPVCPHGLRGTHATLAEAAGVTSHVVAASLGHVSDQVTGRHYTLPDARTGAQQQRFLTVIEGGR